MGKPEREVANLSGATLHFVRGPTGSHTYFVHLDQNDRVISWEQVLTEARFKLVKPGMTQEEVINLIGASTHIFGLARGRGTAWYYRYETQFCHSFAVEFTAENVVRSTGYVTRTRGRCFHWLGPLR
jgi:outer membrane protein assembly factor BamE (lipoprotein component of BamABCDE complex)